ncbi:hypothetical protein Trydic_g1901 [Trypoxylus dichotomus]
MAENTSTVNDCIAFFKWSLTGATARGLLREALVLGIAIKTGSTTTSITITREELILGGSSIVLALTCSESSSAIIGTSSETSGIVKLSSRAYDAFVVIT